MRLAIDGVRFSYGKRQVLQDVSLAVSDGEVVSLAGPNGSGKTTLLKCINRLHAPRAGSIRVGEKNVADMGLKELSHAIGYVPQSAATSFPLTVFDMVLLGRKPHLSWGIGRRDKDVVFSMLDLMDLGEMAFRPFNELSGGEKQKVLIARALAQEPAILLLDEPTSNLDLRHQIEVLGIVADLAHRRGLSAIMAIHDLNLAALFSDRIVMLKNGIIHAAGTAEETLTPSNIREVYGVDAMIGHDADRPYVIPLVSGSPRRTAAATT